MVAIAEKIPGSTLQKPPEIEIISTRKEKIYSTRYTLATKLNGKLTSDEKKAAGILQELDISDISADKPLSMNEKGLLFFAYLWHETRDLNSIKRFEDIREDFLDRMFDSLDDRLSTAYERFYDLYKKATERSRTPGFKDLLKKGLTLKEAAQEAEISEENPLYLRLRQHAQEDSRVQPEVLKSTLKQIANEKRRKKPEVGKNPPEEEFVRQIRSGIAVAEAIRASGVEEEKVSQLLINLLVAKHSDAGEILLHKQNGLRNTEILERVKKPIKYVNNITRVLQFLEMIPFRFRTEQVEKQNELMRRIMKLRSQNLGNIEISEKLKIRLSKIEDATRFLVWVGLLDPMNKSDVLMRAYNKTDYKQQVRGVINKQDLSPNAPFLGLRRLYEASGLEIGFDKFSRLFHEIEQEPGQKVPRYKHKPFKNRPKPK